MLEKGRIIYSGVGIKDLPRLLKQYGGNARDWTKMTSDQISTGGRTIQTHWYENVSTGIKYEMKTKIIK